MMDQDTTNTCIYCNTRPANDAVSPIFCSPQCMQKWWIEYTDNNGIDDIDYEVYTSVVEFMPIPTIPATLEEGCITCRKCCSKVSRDGTGVIKVKDDWWCTRCVSRYLGVQ